MTTATSLPNSDTKFVPKQAMQFDCGKLSFQNPIVEDDGISTSPISMLARSPEPIFHWYWGKTVHDMAGFSADNDRVPIDFRHDDELPIGYLDSFEASETEGLKVSGKLVSFEAGDLTSKLMKQKKGGIPYQASIFFRDEETEFIPEDTFAMVNGQKFEGPGIIFRKWGLRGMAVCLYGADHRTNSEFANDGKQQVFINIKKGGNAMSEPASDETPTTTPAADEVQTETVVEVVTEETETDPAPATPAEAAALSARSELKKFVAKFGATNGAKWFGEGVSFSDAMEKHTDELAQQLSAKDQEIASLNKKLASIDRGEKTPLSFSESTPEKPKGFKSNIRAGVAAKPKA